MKLDTAYVDKFISKKELSLMDYEVEQAHNMLEKAKGEGSDYLGWLRLPSETKSLYIKSIQDEAASIQTASRILIVIGIGGSYLGSRAGIEFISRQSKTKVIFAGNNMDPAYLSNLLDEISGKDVSINVISKSGTTIEPAAAFRILMAEMKKRYSKSELTNRVICTTTYKKGALYAIAKKNNYRMFYIPENIGGRFSVLTAVGLLPMAVSGIDIDSLMEGALDIERKSRVPDIKKNIVYKYAALRNLLYRNGKKIEIGCSFSQSMFFILEWWKQLFAESEGKEGKGIFPATAIFSTDLHANGQLIQEGERNIFETFLVIAKKDIDIKLPFDKDNLEGLNYLSGKGLSFVNKMAYKGTALAHMQGGVPNMSIIVNEPSAFCLGQIFYFFQKSAGISGYLLRVNPFNQPGVEAYKKNMMQLLKKRP